MFALRMSFKTLLYQSLRHDAFEADFHFPLAKNLSGLQVALKYMLVCTLRRLFTSQSYSVSLQMTTEVLYKNLDWTSILSKMPNTAVQTLIGNIWYK